MPARPVPEGARPRLATAWGAALAVALLALAGCLPSSQRQAVRGLFPSDSGAAALAALVPLDSLRPVWIAAADDEALEYPTTVQFAADSAGVPTGRLLVTDTQTGTLHAFGATGRYLGVVADGLEFPFLVGGRGDTVAVLNRGVPRLDLLVGRRTVRQIALPEGEYPTALVTASGTFYKTVADETARLVRLDSAGRAEASFVLDGPAWRHFGFLRAWGDSVLSLSGYRPVVDVLAPGSAAPDTLALHGFDSPLLPRSYQFAIGEADEPPLLTSAAAAWGDRLFVLNLRDGHVRVDVYGRDGSLERVLASGGGLLPFDAYPADLAVRADSTGAHDLAVLMQRPGAPFRRAAGRLVLFRWTPPEQPAAGP